jgi:hypothetical protein
MERRGPSRIALAAAPFVGLAIVLKQVPDAATSFQPMPWSHAAAYALVLLGLVALHAHFCAKWSPAAPRRIATNELLVRLLLVTFGLLIVAAHPHGQGGLFLLGGLLWAALSWLTHRSLAWKEGGYRALPNVALLGLFMLGLALLALVSLSGLILAQA